MSKGPRIKPTIKRVIVEEAVKDTKKPRRQLMVELQTIIERMGEIVPAEETLEKLISRARNHPKSPLDEPWHVVTLADYNMPAEALPALLLIWGKSQEEPDEPLTIREAKWVARLYRLVNNIEFLYVYAKHYALEEKTAEITGALPASAANVFFGAWWLQRPALEPLLFRWGRGLPDLEMIAASIYERPPKEAEEAVERLRVMMAEVVKAAGLPKPFLAGLQLRTSEKEAHRERSHTSKG